MAVQVIGKSGTLLDVDANNNVNIGRGNSRSSSDVFSYSYAVESTTTPITFTNSSTTKTVYITRIQLIWWGPPTVSTQTPSAWSLQVSNVTGVVGSPTAQTPVRKDTSTPASILACRTYGTVPSAYTVQYTYATFMIYVPYIGQYVPQFQVLNLRENEEIIIKPGDTLMIGASQRAVSPTGNYSFTVDYYEV